MSPEFKSWLASDPHKCLLAEVECRVGGSETVRYLSTSGYVTKSSDSPSNTVYVGRLMAGFSFSRSLDIKGFGSSSSYGEIRVDNTDGALDSWVYDIWAGRKIRLFLGHPAWARSEFEKVFEGVVADIEPVSKSALAFRLRDTLAVLDEPLSKATVGGTGDNKDTLLPIALGECFNVEPLLLSPSGLATYRVNTGVVEQIVEVRDNGYPITVTKDAAAGTFTLNFQRWGQITCDVQGTLVGGQYRNDVGGLVEWVATSIGDTPRMSAADIDTGALTAFRSAYPQPVGRWVNSSVTRLALIKELAASIGATPFATLQGKLRLVQLAYSAPTRTVTASQMVGGSLKPSARPEVKGSLKLMGSRNWTQQSADSLAAALEPNQVTILTEPWVTNEVSDNTVISNYRKTGSPEETQTLLVVESDIQAEATRRLNLWKTPRTVFSFTAYAEFLDVELGETITVFHPRLGLDVGKPALVTGVESDFINGRVGLEVLV